MPLFTTSWWNTDKGHMGIIQWTNVRCAHRVTQTLQILKKPIEKAISAHICMGEDGFSPFSYVGWHNKIKRARRMRVQ